MTQQFFRERLWGRWLRACAVAVLFGSAAGEAQVARTEVRHVRWPLLDMVLLSDSSAGIWLMVAPNPATTAWDAGTPLVSLGIDPVLALQWVTVARALRQTDTLRRPSSAAMRLTPPLSAKRGQQFLVLAKSARQAGADEPFILVVSDSSSHTHWKTFASPAQVDTLLAALESTAMSSRTRSSLGDSTTAPGVDDGAVDTPVSIISMHRPVYPGALAGNRRIGRVWMEYTVGVDGRAEERSFRPLLSDDSLFTRAAVRALLRAKYSPARLHGKPIRQRVFQVITFRVR